MTIFDGQFFWTYFQLVTCDIWDTDYNTDNWETGFMTIFVTWQLIVTLDSIRNSCDVLKTRQCRKAKSVGEKLFCSAFNLVNQPFQQPTPGACKNTTWRCFVSSSFHRDGGDSVQFVRSLPTISIFKYSQSGRWSSSSVILIQYL